MNTRILMLGTCFYLAFSGFLLSFLPQEVAYYFDSNNASILIIALQIVGALYFGFAMMNWMKRNSTIGGIYNRPLVFGNLLHFFIGSFALIKIAQNFTGDQFVIIIILAVLYLLFALAFIYCIRKSPIKIQD